MIPAMIASIERLSETLHPEILEWACPVPCFGDPSWAQVATVGINPSNKEFVDDAEVPLAGAAQRFPTMGTLGLERWGDAGPTEIRTIADACRRYFDGNSYDRWFGVLDELLEAAGMSFYGLGANACHLDLVPFATTRKWGRLNPASQRELVELGTDLFRVLLADSTVELVVLNGRSVVESFELTGHVTLDRDVRDDWALPRSTGHPVVGTQYTGVIDEFAGYDLGRRVRILGYNHNLQSSYGVTRDVKAAIAQWVAEGVSA